MASNRRALLGRLAEFRWFSQQGEPAATRALAMLLEDEPLRMAFVREIEQRSGVPLGAVSYFVAEAVHADGARPDLEGLDDDSKPLIVVEAKFGAHLGEAQIRNYLSDQADRLGKGGTGVLVLLVPSSRVIEAQRVLEASDAGGTGVVVTWDDCITCCEEAAKELPNATEIANDLFQFKAMCTTLGGIVIAPLGNVALGKEWRAREEDLRQIVRLATESFVPAEVRVPFGNEPGYEHRRYMPGVRYEGSHQGLSSCSVGIGSRFVEDGLTPFWLRYHRQTIDFAVVKERLSRSSYAAHIRNDDRHLWLPLHADPSMSGNELVQSLEEQIQRIILAASAD